MFQVLIVVHIMIAIALVGVVLVQRSEGGGLGIGASGGMGSFMTARGTTNLLTRTTGILAAAFMVVSLALAIIAGAGRERRSIVDQIPAVPAQPSTPAPPTRCRHTGGRESRRAVNTKIRLRRPSRGLGSRILSAR
jgi:preprotein translocase subunit SecG